MNNKLTYNYIYTYIYIYNLLENCDIEFIDTQKICSKICKKEIEKTMQQFKINIGLVDLKKNMMLYGTFFPFFYNDDSSEIETIGSHRLYVITTIKSHKRHFAVCRIKDKNKYNIFIKLSYIKTQLSQDSNQFRFSGIELENIKKCIAFNANNFYFIKNTALNHKNMIGIFNWLGTEISFELFSFYSLKNLDIISKHPIINCRYYYIRYKNKVFQQIKYKLGVDFV